MNKTEWFGELPSTWDVTRLKNVLIERKESNKPVKTDFILSLTNDRGVIPYSEKGAVGNNSKDDITGYKLAYPKDLVLNSMNVVIGSVGISEYFGCVSPVYYVLRPRNHEDPVEFYNYLFQTNEMQSALKGYGNGIMEIRMRIAMSKLNTFNLPIPSSQAQRKIVDRIRESENRIDQLIANQQQQIEKLKEYKQSLICEVVTKGLDQNVDLKDSGIQWVGMIPRKWSIDRLKYVASSNDESLSNTHNSESLIEYVDIGSVSQEKGIEKTEYFTFNEAPSRARRMTKINDILVSTVRTYLKAIAVVDRDNLIASTGFSVIRPNNKVNNAYLSYYIKSDYFTELVSAYSNGISYPAINDSVLMSFYVIKPPLNEQEKISVFLKKKVTEIDKMVSIKEEKIEKLNEYKKSLIYEYVTGKKEVS
jgi:type I restriction enzyme S subunit